MDPARRARWRALLAPIDPETAAHDAAWEFDPPTWMFHAFRPDGDGIDSFFPESPAGRAAADRLRLVFAAAPEPTAYLIPRRRSVPHEALLQMARDHLARMRSLLPLAVEASEVEADDPVIALLEPEEIVIGQPDREPADEGCELLYVLAAWYGSSRDDLELHDLREPLYGLACLYEVANFVLAPLLDFDGAHGDPFAPWFELWRNGYSLRFDERDRRCVIFG